MPPTIMTRKTAYGTGTVYSWASILDEATRDQALRTSRSPILSGHLALMPDAHLGSGATIGSVLLTEGGIIPAAVGVDIGCGMIAYETNIPRDAITKRDEHLLLGYLREHIPNGVGQNHDAPTSKSQGWFRLHGFAPGLAGEPSLQARAMNQFGTLGSGNHFAEFSTDDTGMVWAIVHSGSRGVGLALAQRHINVAKIVCPVEVEDPDLAFLVEGTSAFADYITDMQWAQQYAYGQRQAMMDVMMDALEVIIDSAAVPYTRINCHHNYAHQIDDGRWLTRKGAIAADVGQYGVVPGSMGTDTYIVEGLGNGEAYNSAPHGAGRVLSRGAAHRTLDVEDLKTMMGDRTWGDRDAVALLDESPKAYKDINMVMADAADLVHPVGRLTQFINFKAADGRRHR